MIDRRELVHALERRELADWVVIERDQELAAIDEVAPALRRSERRTRWQLSVASDVPSGRGTTRLAVDARDGSAEELVDQAVGLARAAIGPAWTTLPPAAPAKVTLLDPALTSRPLVDVAASTLHELRRPAGVTTSGAASALRERVVAQTKQGLRVEWSASLVRARVLVSIGDHSLELVREARRLGDLGLDAAVGDAARDLALVAGAVPATARTGTLVLATDAMLHDGLGVWSVFATQADAVVARQGLTRYRVGAPIAAGADKLGEALTLSSDGALELGLRSAPIGDDGEAVRRFVVVDRGVAVGLGLSPREASLRHLEPNGGVRNVIVEPGSWAGTIEALGGDVIEVRRLRGLAIDPYTGDASLEVALGIAHVGGTARPFVGGTVRLDLIDALAHARRAATRIRRGAYVGPSALAIAGAELLA